MISSADHLFRFQYSEPHWSAKRGQVVANQKTTLYGLTINDKQTVSYSKIDMAQWGHAVDGTSHRAGFVVCGDLEVASRMVSAEPVTVGGPQVKDKIKELVLYSISEEYFAVRQQMGITIG